MDVASLPHYLRVRSRMLSLVVVLAMLIVGVGLLGYAVFAGLLTSDPSHDVRMLAPFRWMLDASVEA